MAQMNEPDSAEAGEHSQGSPLAKLTLLEYGDYECPFCARAEPMTQRLVEDCGERLRFVYRHFPLMEIHLNAELAAEAAEAAAAQGRFWEMHRLLFGHSHNLTLPTLTSCAESVGLDMIRFKAEMADRIYTQRVQEHRRAGELSGLRSTPAFFLNGAQLDLSSGSEQLEQIVHAALARA